MSSVGAAPVAKASHKRGRTNSIEIIEGSDASNLLPAKANSEPPNKVARIREAKTSEIPMIEETNHDAMVVNQAVVPNEMKDFNIPETPKTVAQKEEVNKDAMNVDLVVVADEIDEDNISTQVPMDTDDDDDAEEPATHAPIGFDEDNKENVPWEWLNAIQEPGNGFGYAGSGYAHVAAVADDGHFEGNDPLSPAFSIKSPASPAFSIDIDPPTPAYSVDSPINEVRPIPSGNKSPFPEAMYKSSREPAFIDKVVLNSEVLLDARGAIAHTIHRVFGIMKPEYQIPDRATIMGSLTMNPNLADVYHFLGAHDEESDPNLKQWIRRHKTIMRLEGMQMISLRKGAMQFLETMQWHGMPVLLIVPDFDVLGGIINRLGVRHLITAIYPFTLHRVIDGEVSFPKNHARLMGAHSYRRSPIHDESPEPCFKENELNEVLFVSCTPHTTIWAKMQGLQTAWLKVTEPLVEYIGFDYQFESLGELRDAIFDNNEHFTSIERVEKWGWAKPMYDENGNEIDPEVEEAPKVEDKTADEVDELMDEFINFDGDEIQVVLENVAQPVAHEQDDAPAISTGAGSVGDSGVNIEGKTTSNTGSVAAGDIEEVPQALDDVEMGEGLVDAEGAAIGAEEAAQDTANDAQDIITIEDDDEEFEQEMEAEQVENVPTVKDEEAGV